MKHDYDMIVIGGGAAGLTASGMAASFGAKTAMIEADRLGGDCTWTGCVPSKTLLKAAKVANTIRKADHYGLIPAQPKLDFAKVLDHVHKIQEEVYADADAPEIYESLGVDVISATARFVDRNTLELTSSDQSSRKLTSRFFVIATGSSAVVPPIQGLAQVPYLTNETVFSNPVQPQSLMVIGAGPIGIEMAQAFARLGSKVKVVDMASGILIRDDRELAAIMQDQLIVEGMEFFLNKAVKQVEKRNGTIQITVEDTGSGALETLSGDALLLAVGRKANTGDLNLEAAGVDFDRTGITVNKSCRTSARNIFACGDVAGRFQFTHFAEHMAKVAVSNALLRFPMSLDSKHMTWCTYTDPELAHVGASEASLIEQGASFETYRFPFSKIDRAITEGEKVGWIKVFAKKINGKIYGASILGANAGEMIGEYALAMRNGVTLRQLADTIHPYPTYVLGNRRAADQWYVRKQSRAFVWLLQRIFRYQGQLPDTSDKERIV